MSSSSSASKDSASKDSTSKDSTSKDSTSKDSASTDQKSEGNPKIVGILLFLLFLLTVLGIVAMIWSLVCFGKSGTILEKIIGVVIAFFVGPFYFIYYLANKEYCR